MAKIKQKRLTKSKDKMISGVCAGIAEYLDVDPTMIRLAWVIITIFSGIFLGILAYRILAYIIAAIIIPEQK
jgi:phage shock protein C